MRVQLLLTCLCDAFYGDVGVATVKVLEHAGCVVEFPEGQTCCGQPAFNSGDWTSARTLAQRTAKVFAGTLVTPSASCAAMLRHGYPTLGLEPPPCYELCEFLILVMGVGQWPLGGNRISRRRKVALHQACHTRVLGDTRSQAAMLSLIPGVELVPLGQQDQCCGFGGAFSVTHPTVSSGIGLDKLNHLVEASVDEVVSGDMGCLMHLQGLIDRSGLQLRTKHVAQVLAEAIA